MSNTVLCEMNPGDQIIRAHDPDEIGCDRCDGPGNPHTYANQAVLPIGGKTACIDWCIHKIVAALNAANIPTYSSCCGHRYMPGHIILEDGRTLAIFEDFKSAVEVCWPDHQGDIENVPPSARVAAG